jgi:RloB-like protein
MARQSRHKVEKPRVAVVGEGQTEQIYFLEVRDTDRPADIDLFPSLPAKKGSYKNVLQKAMELAPDYRRVYALIDMDTVISDGLEAEYAMAKKAALEEGIIVLENNPCFEIWPRLHFGLTTRSFACCDEVCAELENPGRLPGYEKSRKFLAAARMYANYKDRITTHAIPAAKHLEKDRPAENKRYPRAGIHVFFEWYLDPNRADKL